jgi:hypothetical protein
MTPSVVGMKQMQWMDSAAILACKPPRLSSPKKATDSATMQDSALGHMA